MKTTYEFSVIASGLDPASDDFETCFIDAGCDDATVSFQKGHIIIDFARAADSIDEAITSAIEDVRTTGSVVERVEPDPLVSLSEISARTNLTRAAVSLYAKGARASDLRGKSFPAPIARITSESPLYSWPSVANWFFLNEKLPRAAVVEAEVLRIANERIGLDNAALRECLKQSREECEARI